MSVRLVTAGLLTPPVRSALVARPAASPILLPLAGSRAPLRVAVTRLPLTPATAATAGCIGCLSAAALASLAGAGRGRRGAKFQRGARVVVAAESAEGTSRAAKDGDSILVNYKVSLADGTLADSTEGRDPLNFTLGKRKVMKGFEDAARGLCVGDRCEVTLPPEYAYGERREELVLDIDAAQVPPGVNEGMTLQLSSGGRPIPVRVVKVKEDGSIQVDANHKLAGETLQVEMTLVGFRELLASVEPPPGMELATFAAGCFWGVELAFQRVAGVMTTNVGYAQGEMQAPEYEDICTGKTGHTEAVRVVFDPSVVTFEELLPVFWERVGKNATTLNQAGNDVGTQYRSGIYYHSEEQQRLAEKSALELQMKLGEPVVTEVKAAEPFWLAEEYHQQYLEKGGRGGNAQSAEKGCKEPIRCYG